ncbi:MAG: hypothetical protein K8F91_17050 [Candidatus Obscuribacterales bacterium]|nr:hypothetical protein [Candidatus Obscuribacterales bacterium]
MTNRSGALLKALEEPEKPELAKLFNSSLLTPEAVARGFLSLYPHRQAFIWKGLEERNWRKSSSQLRDHQIMGVISDGGRGLFRGCYFGELTRFAVLDVDQGSKYHNPAELLELTNKLASVGLTVTPYQSSDSGGWHLYLFFDDWAKSEEVSQSLRKWLRLEGYEIKGGVLEVFPSGCALRLPLQPGFAWLDSQGEVICRREEINETEALASFLSDLESNACSWTLAKSRIESQIEVNSAAGAGSAPEHQKAIDLEGFEKLWTNGQIKERIEEARYYLDNGLTERGQRHDAVYTIEHLLWYGDADRGIPRMPGTENDERRAQFLVDWLKENHNGKCRHVNRGAWRLLEGHIRRACEWRGNHHAAYEKTPYAVTERSTDAMIRLTKTTGRVWKPEDLEKANQKRERAARERIREAVQQFEREGRRLTIKGLALASGCDRKTVRKHSDIHGISSLGLSKWGSDIDPLGGGGVACSLKAPVVLDQPASGFLSEEKKLDPPVESETSSGLDDPANVVPLSSCLAQEPTTCTQYQSQALWVPAGALTPGPVLRGIQAGTAGCAGGIFLCFPPGSLAGAEVFRAGVCLSSACLFFGRRTTTILKRIPSRPAKTVQFSRPPEGLESITSHSVNTRAIEHLRQSATPHKPESGGVLCCCNQCTQLPSQALGDYAYRRTRGPPLDVIQHE